MRRSAICAFVLSLVPLGALAQNAGSPTQAGQPAPSELQPWSSPDGGNPTFEVATIKPSDPDACCARTFGRNGRHFQTTNTNLKYLIQWAWNLQAKQVAGGPPWMDEMRFNLSGVMDGTGTPNDRQWKIAVQNLLMDRFQIKLHHEAREMPAFVLTIAKGGAKLTAGDGDTKTHQYMGFSGGVGETMHGRGVNAAISDFVGELQRIVMDRPIVDRTGLTGVYNIQFAFTREDPNSLGMTQLPDNAAPNLITALDEQLGLKLEGTKAPVDVLVIDSAEHPSAD